MNDNISHAQLDGLTDDQRIFASLSAELVGAGYVVNRVQAIDAVTGTRTPPDGRSYVEISTQTPLASGEGVTDAEALKAAIAVLKAKGLS